MKPRVFIIVGVIAILFGLLRYMPASFLMRSANMGVLTVNDLNGTLWQGSGKLNLNGVTLPLRWKFNPLSPLALNASWRMNIDESHTNGELTLAKSFSGVLLNRTNITMPAATLAQMAAPILLAMNPQGEIKFNSYQLSIKENDLEGDAEITWNDAGFEALPDNHGVYIAKILGENGVVKLSIKTTQGALKISGEGSWSAAAGITFNGTITPPANAPADLTAMLAQVGTASADGRYVIRYQGR